MKAVIEIRVDGKGLCLFLVRIYNSDGIPCDAYVVDSIEFTNIVIPPLHYDGSNSNKKER